jgi:hypothetical protein
VAVAITAADAVDDLEGVRRLRPRSATWFVGSSLPAAGLL